MIFVLIFLMATAYNPGKEKYIKFVVLISKMLYN